MLNKPLANIFESTLIGTGGGYGESQVIHLGKGDWIVIDSCINPNTKKSLPLEYLESIGVNLKTDVKLILCTHWHDDHIKGISDLLDRCEAATFSIAKATDKKKFLRLIGLDSRKNEFDTSISSTNEFSRCLNIIESRKLIIRQAIEDRLIISRDEIDFKYEVYSLSPSDYVMEKFDGEISTLISDFGNTNKKIIIETPNDKSVALFIKVNSIRVLLGSDLEVDLANNQKVWLRILYFN